MSDLQCPATVLFVAREQLASIDPAHAFAAHRVVGVFAGAPDSDATARSWADGFGCPLETLPEIRAAEDLEEAVQDLSDAYRGETIVVVAPAAVIQARLRLDRPPTAPLSVAIDSSGWFVRTAG